MTDSPSPISLAGKTALVTGGASGIGLAVARHFRQLGATVLVADLAEQAPAGFEGAYARGDVCDEADVARMVDSAAPQGGWTSPCAARASRTSWCPRWSRTSASGSACWT